MLTVSRSNSTNIHNQSLQYFQINHFNSIKNINHENALKHRIKPYNIYGFLSIAQFFIFVITMQNLIFYFWIFFMSDRSNSHKDSNETVLGWKFVIIVGVLSTIFLSFFYLAMTQEPDYMPGAQRKAQQEKQLAQHASAASEVVEQNQQK